MNVTKNKVAIKGTKDGLVFYLDDQCGFEELLEELEKKMEHSHQQILTGPLIRVSIRLGKRYVTAEQEKEIKERVRARGNLVVHQIESDVITKEEAFLDKMNSMMRLEVGTVRNGQVIEHTGDVMVLGDVNPGGIVKSGGNIFIMGALRGIAHAGVYGDTMAIIACSYMKPTQLRIAEVISRPPDEWTQAGSMVFAYLDSDKMSLEKISLLSRIRPNLKEKI